MNGVLIMTSTGRRRGFVPSILGNEALRDDRAKDARQLQAGSVSC